MIFMGVPKAYQIYQKVVVLIDIDDLVHNIE